jgi:Flp pilus assembly pilin Flp
MSRRNERAATLVEYALIVALVAIPSIAAVDFLADSARQEFSQSAGSVSRTGSSEEATTTSTPPSTAVPSTTTTTTPPASTTSTTTTSAPPPSTTTTVAPTTTSTTTTTAPPVATLVGGTFGAVTTSTSGSNWSATTTLTVRNNLGLPVAGAAVSVRVRTLEVDNKGNQTWRESTVGGSTGSGGTATVSSGSLARTGNPKVTQVQFVLNGITAAGLSWDGTPATAGAAAP